MGAVYLAQDRRAFDRLCVVKQMIEYYDVANPQERQRAQQRFEEEGRTLATLSHPGIPRIYSFIAEGGRYYIVMEYIEGENLETFVTHENGAGQTVPAKRMPQEQTVRYMIQACGILQYLHSQPRPVVHQDIKPANLILESQLGLVRLVDFGTACVEIPTRDLAQPLSTRTGTDGKPSVYGTDGYAPPEQYRGKTVPRSDVFALAATAYHLLTDDDPSKHPFKWEALPRLPRELGIALERALRAEVEHRSSAKDLLDALETFATPRRALETFTFPGGHQIRSVVGLPSLCDEHWEAARSYLYKGDLTRWLRDINRLDLVAAAETLCKQESNRDAGLECFLHVVDPGQPAPKLVADPLRVELGHIAREAALIRHVDVLNVTRGYTLAQVTSDQPWLEVYPAEAHLWAGRPVDVSVNVHAEGLPFRRRQQGTVRIEADGQPPLIIPVTAQVSLLRETWRILRRAVMAALPESGRTAAAGYRVVMRATGATLRRLVQWPWLMWLVWVLVGAAIGAGLYWMPPWVEGFSFSGWAIQRPTTWPDFLPPVALGPFVVVLALWLLWALIMLIGGAIWGALRGAWRSFFR